MGHAGTSRRAVDRIASWVVGGRYAPGESLPVEAALGQELEVSRTVVREALKTLAAKGMVVTGPRRGTRVRPRTEWNHFDPDLVQWRINAGIDADFVRDLVTLRGAIEPAAARLAAEACTDDDVAALYAAFEAMRRAADGQGVFLQADLDFHHRVLTATHNQFFAGMAHVFSALLAVSIRLSVASVAGARAALPVHRRVLDAIGAHDPAAAEKAMQALIATARKDLASHSGPQRATA